MNRKQRAHDQTPSSRRPWLVAAMVVVAAAGVLWAVAARRRPSVTRAETNAYRPVTGQLTWPAMVAAADPGVQALYQFVARRPDVEHYLPCFCGCWRAGHRSNYDCFVDELRADGSVAIDEMGFT